MHLPVYTDQDTYKRVISDDSSKMTVFIKDTSQPNELDDYIYVVEKTTGHSLLLPLKCELDNG